MTSPHFHVPFHKLEDHIGFIKRHRANVELYLSSQVLDVITIADITKLRSEFDYGPDFSIHAPFMDLSPGAVDSRVREATMARFNQVMEMAEALRPRVIVFHSGYEKWRYGLNMELWLERSLITWRPLMEAAERIGTQIAIENIFEDEPANLRLLMERMNTSGFGICFDTGHFNLFSKTPLEDWMAALNPFIIELHLHDNDGSRDQHLPMGEGNFDFKKFFRLLNNNACLHTIEAHSEEHALRSLSYYSDVTGL